LNGIVRKRECQNATIEIENGRADLSDEWCDRGRGRSARVVTAFFPDPRGGRLGCGGANSDPVDFKGIPGGCCEQAVRSCEQPTVLVQSVAMRAGRFSAISFRKRRLWGAGLSLTAACVVPADILSLPAHKLNVAAVRPDFPHKTLSAHQIYIERRSPLF
jgi:hypothetical protein